MIIKRFFSKARLDSKSAAGIQLRTSASPNCNTLQTLVRYRFKTGQLDVY
jgi:hypothetical protein